MFDILAQRSPDHGDGGWIKFVFGAIFFLIWVISALGTWLNKKREEERRRRLREQLERGTPSAPTMSARARLNQPPVQRAPKRSAQRAPKPPRQPAQRYRALPVPPPIPVSRGETQATTRPVTATDVSTVKRGGVQAPGATAVALARWLRPDTLRRQFMLTEILQPPLALREPRDVL